MATTRYVAFLRGINVGRNKRVAMADLRDLCDELGFEGVRTQGQSGNIVLDSGSTAAGVERSLAAGIKKALSIEVKVVVRTARQLGAVLERNPFAEYVEVPRYSTVSFLAAKPNSGALSGIDPEEYLPERFELHGRELFILFASGQNQSRLIEVLTDKQLGTATTNRNWNTLEKVFALTSRDP